MKRRRSDRGRLVRWWADQIPASFYAKIPGAQNRGRGIYVLHRGRKIYYVGLSKSSLRGRIRSHFRRDRHRGKWDTFSFFQFRRTKYIKDVETLLLRVFRSEGQRVLGRFPSRFNWEKKWRMAGKAL